jgi:hypothetical protein
MMSVIVMTVIGDVRRPRQGEGDEFFPAPQGFCWRFVSEGPLAVQFRSILRMDARAVVVWVGAGDAVDRAANMIARLVEIGPSIVVAVGEVHEPWRESTLRQAGALYICANEAEQRLCQVLESILGPQLRSTNVPSG